MDYTQKITLSSHEKNKNMIYICILGSISVLGIVMTVYSLIHAKFLFALIYFIAVILGFSYVIMKINTIMPTYLAVKDNYIYMQNWKNGFFPFRTDKGFIGEFLPEKTNLKKIDINSVSKVYFGSRNYLLRLVESGDFNKNLNLYKKKYNNILKQMEFFYVCAKDGEEIYMPVNGFDEKEMVSLLKSVLERNEKIDFKSNNRLASKEIPAKRMTF
ncbi:MAG: hypothetical protein SOZ34_04970 [Clostridia bacterium]|nr:hypothetical protein [Clostridia bacterium]